MNDINEKHVRTSNIVKIPGVMRHIWMYVFVFHRKNENHTGLDQHEGEEIVFGELLSSKLFTVSGTQIWLYIELKMFKRPVSADRAI